MRISWKCAVVLPNGELHLVDRDPKVDLDNRQRYILLTTHDVEQYKGMKKVDWDSDVIEYLDSSPVKPGILLAISAVDNVQARIDIADCLAFRTINAGTVILLLQSQDTALEMGMHV
jgi:hypothetical protein